MKKKVRILKSRIAPPVDFGAVTKGGNVCGVELEKTEFDFVQLSGRRLVLFDAYSAAHKYNAFDVDFGIVAFPFYLSCMTDSGERVAYCGMRFDEGEPAEWKLLCDDESLARLQADGDAASVPISSGVCVIADEAAYAEYREHIRDEIHPLSGHIILNGQTHEVISLFGRKYAVFSGGWGGGKYKCFAGYAEDGKPIALIVDFGMIEYPKRTDEPVEVEIDTGDGEVYVYDPKLSARENDIAKWSNIIEHSKSAVERLHAYSRRGYMHHSSGDENGALADYVAAIAECKRITDKGELARAWSVYDNAAEIYRERSDYQAAIDVMNAALDADNEMYSGAYVRLVDLYLLTKRTDEAREMAERLIKAHGNDPTAHAKYAECAVSAMDYVAAAREYDVLATEFRLYDSLFDEASCLIALGENKRAQTVLERYPAKQYSEKYMYYHAYIAYRERRIFAAIDLAEKAYRIDPEYMPALYLLIDMQSAVQDYRAVARYAEEYIRLRPDNEFGYCVCAEAHLVLGEFSDSARNYRHLYERIKPIDMYAALAAVLYSRMGEKKTGNKLLRMLKRKRSPYHSAALYAIDCVKYRKRDDALSRMVLKQNCDADFLLRLAVYLTAVGEVLSATRILEGLASDPTYEVVAQQIRAAERIGDKKLFDSFLDYYIENFIGGTLTATERMIVTERFLRDPTAREDWLPKLAVLTEQLEMKRAAMKKKQP